MSVARDDFMRSLSGIREAIALESVAQGATGSALAPGVLVLRRGILIAGLIALETFVRDRTTEALGLLNRWPRSFDDLPANLREAARLDALSHLQQYAKMLKRQGDDYESVLRFEIAKMGSGDGTALQFTKFVAGDYTGNVSDTGLKKLLSNLQVHDCWNTFRVLAADTGIGVPSVQELVKSTVRKRHRSAHSAGYAPSATEISALHSDLLCIALCFDVAVTASIEQSLAVPVEWAQGRTTWRSAVVLYILKPFGTRFRLFKFERTRALRIVATPAEAKLHVPRPSAGLAAVLVQQDATGRPLSWDVL
ncbi:MULTISPECIES: hypothetical protein [unclassified Sphingomonas]|jgi:hypothetical protein|uniref:hypothetical protein n=1 Tax=unclassified Sphingomonas TaxID=196159 RepID=UPI000B178BA1|nr:MULTISPECIES: hypothetical protein [unclassified Sphingomonas]